MDREALSQQFGMPRLNEDLGDFVAGLSDDDYKDVMDGVAHMQRHVPESVMESAQRRIGSGLFSHSLEHVGDLSHRINEHGGRASEITVPPKVNVQLGALKQPYGYRREMLEQIQDTNQYRQQYPEAGPPIDLSTLEEEGRRYADAHAEIPPINEPTAAARSAAVSLGHMRFDYTIKNLERLKGMYEGGDFRSHLSRGGALDYLRRRYGR